MQQGEGIGIARWEGAHAGGGIASEAVERMLREPNFSEAMRLSVSGALSLVDKDTVWREAAKNVSRQVIGNLALYLDATGGITHSRLQQLTVDIGLMSLGRAGAILAQLRRLNYVELAAQQPDRRQRLYTPTARMRQAFQAQFQNDLSALCLITPQMAVVRDRFTVPGVFHAFIEVFAADLIGTLRHYANRQTRTDVFFARQAGLLILNALLASGDPQDTFPPKGELHFSLSALAKRFGVSRPHVLKLLRDAQDAGLLHRETGEGVGRLTPELREDVEKFHARNYAVIAASAVAAYSVSG